MGDFMAPQGHSWFMNIIRSIFCFLDGLVYRLIRWILYGVFDISSITTNSDVFSGIAERVYVVLGIFMAFKLSFSFFQYIIDPESMTKSEKGVSKLFLRVFLMLFALILLPTLLFGQGTSKGMLSRAQDAFLPVLPKLILGTQNSSNSGNIDQTLDETADEITVTTLGGFFTPSKEIDEKCGEGTYENTPPIESLEDFENNINLTCDVKGTGVLGIGATKYYKYSYMPFVSTVVGVLIAGLFLAITLDLAKRLFKLIILEVIAPIPIMSLIDPKGSKDGAFGHWVKNLTSTFLDIFIKLGIVYIVIVLIHMVVSANAEGGLFVDYPTFKESGFRSVYLTIFLILGLIFFAKEAPKFIKDSLGLKSDSGGLFDDLKDIGRAAGIVGGAAVAIPGVIGSGIASGRASYLADDTNGKSHNPLRVAKNIGAGLLGAGAGAATAVRQLGGKKPGIQSVMKAMSERNANAMAAGAAGSTFFGRKGSEISSVFTGQTAATRIGMQIAGNQQKQSLIKSITDRASSEMVKTTKTSGTFGSASRITGRFNYKTVNAQYEAAKSAGLSSFSIKDINGASHTISMEDYELYKGNLLTENEAYYIKYANSGATVDEYGHALTGDDAIQDNVIAGFMQDADSAGIEEAIYRDRKKLKGKNDELTTEIAHQKQRQSRAQANDRYSAKK